MLDGKNYTTKEVHINTIKCGDTIIHNGALTTVCNNNIKSDSFMGTSLFGDSYYGGHNPVTKVTFCVCVR